MVPKPRTPGVSDEASGSRSPAGLVSPKSARQALPSSVTRMFAYTKLSAVAETVPDFLPL